MNPYSKHYDHRLGNRYQNDDAGISSYSIEYETRFTFNIHGSRIYRKNKSDFIYVQGQLLWVRDIDIKLSITFKPSLPPEAIDYHFYNETILFNQPIKETIMSLSETPKITVKTFDQLLAMRSLTGIFRIYDHHILNDLQSNTLEGKFLIKDINDTDFNEFRDALSAAGYRTESIKTEAMGNSGTGRRLHGYKVVNNICQELLRFSFEGDKFNYSIHTSAYEPKFPDTVNLLLNAIRVEEPIRINCLIGFGSDGAPNVDVRQIPKDKNIPLDAYYPYIEEGIDSMYARFRDSSSNLMAFIGLPGTGKSTLLREYARRFAAQDGREVYQIHGDKVLLHPAFDVYCAGLPDKSMVIIEDADNIMGKRSDGNQTMSMLLNEIDGVASKDIKFIISTNLPTIASVDEGLLRPGRCFAVREFRALQGDEIATAAQTGGVEFTPTNGSKVLAEILSDAAEVKQPIRAGFGN